MTPFSTRRGTRSAEPERVTELDALEFAPTFSPDGNRLLFHINMDAGHGGASGRYDRLREIAFDDAFVLWQMGLVKETT